MAIQSILHHRLMGRNAGEIGVIRIAPNRYGAKSKAMQSRHRLLPQHPTVRSSGRGVTFLLRGEAFPPRRLARALGIQSMESAPLILLNHA